MSKLRRWWTLTPVAFALVLSAISTAAAQPSSLPADEIERFLLTAEIVDARRTGLGSTRPWRLTLSDGVLTHDASFQSVDVRRRQARVGNRLERDFADSYHFNIAAYRLAGLLGLDHMIPVTVARTWRGDRGSLSWWIDGAFDEKQRLTERRAPPDMQAWLNQLFRTHVFAALIYDTDRNQGNTLHTFEDGAWQVWMIDFSRSFWPRREIRDPTMLQRCDRDLFDRLRALDREQVRAVVGDHLTGSERDALMARRDLIVRQFEMLIAEKGEAAVLY